MFRVDILCRENVSGGSIVIPYPSGKSTSSTGYGTGCKGHISASKVVFRSCQQRRKFALGVFRLDFLRKISGKKRLRS